MVCVNKENYKNTIKKLLTKIPPVASVLILERNKLGFYLSMREIKELSSNHAVSKMSIHNSKGLEADYVIIPEVINSSAGIPSLIPSTRIEKAFSLSDDDYPHAEKRRLFYVVITRAKKRCFFLTEYDSPSTFINELLTDK
ncbi:3'-5' exonuclease [Candidatus Enterovibrio altilux]|uniref:3'-5' exonuclease n=1 Tax=Candidatus Enterovibrio altilux TaxID=1927128 RepID=UPI001CC242B2